MLDVVPSRRLDPALRRLAYEQDDVVARSQLRAIGVDRFAVRNEVAAGRWQTVGTRVVVVHRGPLTFRQRCWVAALHAGPAAAISGRSALRLAGMRAEPEELVDVVVPRDTATVPPLPGIRVRRRSLDVHAIGSPPRLRPEDAAAGVARWAPSIAVAAGLCASVVQQRLTTAELLRTAIARDHSLPGRRVLLAVVNDIEGGAQALGEIRLTALCRRAGFPRPERQQVRLDPDGRRRYLDAVVGGVLLEIDGSPHLDVDRQTDDCFRQNERAIDRETTLRFTSLGMRTQEERIADQIGRAIAAVRGAKACA